MPGVPLGRVIDQARLTDDGSRLICVYCLDLVDLNGVQAECGHIFCGDCLERHLEKNEQALCPLDRGKIQIGKLKSLRENGFAYNFLSRTEVKCSRHIDESHESQCSRCRAFAAEDCTWQGEYSALAAHESLCLAHCKCCQSKGKEIANLNLQMKKMEAEAEVYRSREATMDQRLNELEMSIMKLTESLSAAEVERDEAKQQIIQVRQECDGALEAKDIELNVKMLEIERLSGIESRHMESIKHLNEWLKEHGVLRLEGRGAEPGSPSSGAGLPRNTSGPSSSNGSVLSEESDSIHDRPSNGNTPSPPPIPLGQRNPASSDGDTGRRLLLLQGHKGNVYGLAFGLNGILYSASADRKVFRWRMTDGQEIGNLSPIVKKIFVSDGALTALALRSDDHLWAGDSKGKIHVWKKDRYVKTLNGHDKMISAMVISPRGMLWSAGYDGKIKCWDNSGDATLFRHRRGRIHCLTFVDGSLAASGDEGNIVFWEGNRLVAELHSAHVGPVYALASGPGNMLWSAGADMVIRGWRDRKLEEEWGKQTSSGHTDHILALAVSPDGTVWSGCKGGKIKGWRRGKCVVTLNDCGNNSVYVLAIDPDGCLWAGSSDEKIRRWDVNEYREASYQPGRS